jgi:hypothetical protein
VAAVPKVPPHKLKKKTLFKFLSYDMLMKFVMNNFVLKFKRCIAIHITSKAIKHIIIIITTVILFEK